MRSSREMPGNPWPHDMVLRIENDNQAMLELLWVREALRLDPRHPDAPPRLTATPAPVETTVALRRDNHHLDETWMRLWRAALGQVVLGAGVTDIGELRALHREHPPEFWRGAVPEPALPWEVFDEWYATYIRGLMAHHRVADDPLRSNLPATIAAWERGFHSLVVIPTEGEYTRTLSPSVFVVTETTYRDPEAFAAALDSFPG